MTAYHSQPPPEQTDAARQSQSEAVTAQARQLLAPHVRLPANRDALFSEAFYPAHEWVLDQIDFAGETAVFLPRCWQTLARFAPDGSLHTRLLLALRSLYGHEQQRQIDDLIIAWQQFCATYIISAPRPPELVGQPPTDRAGQPTLFLSYTDDETALAHHLQTELAAFGYACQVQRPPDKGSPDWFTAVAAALGNAYAVLLLVGAHTAVDHWQRVEYLAALDRHKPIIPILVDAATPLPPYLSPDVPTVLVDAAALDELRRRLPPPLPPGRQQWASQSPALRPRLAELAYMDRLKLDVLQHVAQYTRLGGQAVIQGTGQQRLRLNPIVARQEFSHAPWRQTPEMPAEQRRFEDAVAELKAIGRAVLLGDPGSGKTTTFYKLADDLIETALTDPAAPIPLMVSLGLWTDAAEPFPAFLRRSMAVLGDGVEARLAGGRAALLLDGINEIPAGQQADKYRQVRDFLAQYPALPAWVSCREQDYPPERELRLDRVTVAPLDAVRIQEFIHHYLDDLPGYGPEAAADLFWQLAGAAAQETHRRFLAELGPKLADPEPVFWLAGQLPDGLAWGWGFQGYENNHWEAWLKERARPASLLLLATNPYMLFMLLDVYQAYDRALPANRGQLFDRFVETLLLRERLWARNEVTGHVIHHLAGTALVAALTVLAFTMQQQRPQAGADELRGALTALPLADVLGLLTERQRYQAASANLLVLGDEVRFAHQLLQEYFVARAMRERIFPVLAGAGLPTAPPALQAATIWPPDRWWQPSNWEEATILLAGLYSDDCTPVLQWVADANPELAARCIVESGADTPEETKLWLRDRWLPRLTDLKHDPDARARAAIGRALGRIRLADGTPLDNRPGVGFGLRDGVKIPDIAWGEELPAGQVTIGGDKEAYNSFDKRQVTIPYSYRLSCYPITYAQFHCFVEAPDFADPRWWDGMPEEEEVYGTRYRLRELSQQAFPFWNHPRESVSWYQAVAFCRWLSDKVGYVVDLPHEYEWEAAARWPDNRAYPWGNKFDPTKTNTTEGDNVGQTTAVGIYPQGANPKLNLHDLSGNVWEWCRNKYEEPDDDQIDSSGGRRVVRGGSWGHNQLDARAASRYRYRPTVRSLSLGCRVVVRRPPSHPDH